MSRSLADVQPSPHMPASPDGFLYSYDRTDSPPHVLALDVFVKSNVRATEKLVEKEYEILDANGNALKGPRARQTLRKSATTTLDAGPADNNDDEDFELV